MDSYTPLLEKTRVPQPSLQKLAVISIFSKLRSSPRHLDPDSDPGREAITYCLNSSTSSPAVVDQSVRELCRLVKDLKLDISRGLLELQSALEAASDPRFVTLFVKGLGFLVNLGFQKNPNSFRFQSSDSHPYVKILSCRTEVHSELVRQVVTFMVQNKHLGIVEVCEFLRPFLNYSIIRMPVSAHFSSFIRNLVSSIASLCCSFPKDAIPVIKLLIGRAKFFPRGDAEDLVLLSYLLQCTLDAYMVVLRQLEGNILLVREAQLCGVELLEAIFYLPYDLLLHLGGVENILEMARHLLVVQREIGLCYVSEFSAVILSLYMPLIKSKVEHEQLAIMKVLLFLLEWKSESGCDISGAVNGLNEELLFIFPVLNIVSSPCKLVKQAAVCILSFLEKLLIDFLFSPNKGWSFEAKFPAISKPECIMYRCLLHTLFQDQSLLSASFYLNFASAEAYIEENGHNMPKPWTSLLRDYSLQIFGKMKSSLPLSQTEEMFSGEISFIVGSVATIFLTNQKLRNSSVDLLAAIGRMKPELGIALLLVVPFYSHAFSVKEKEIDFHGMLIKLLFMIPSLASHSAMVPLVIQTVLPMLHKDAKVVLYGTAIRLICKTWEINDRVFGSLQGVLLPAKFVEFSSNQDIRISMAASVRDVCRSNPDRGVDLVLSVAACIENEDPLVKSLGLQSLAHLCEADVIDFYTAWDVIAKHVVNYRTDAFLAYSLCLLLRWGALDAEVYAESAMNILKILWEVGTSRPADNASLWAKTRASAFLALSQFEVEHIMRSIPKFKDMNMELLISETDAKVLEAIEGFEATVMNYEHINRRRLVKQKRVPRNKIEKLLDIFPQVMFPRGDKSRVRELPGAALLCLSVATMEMNKGAKGIQEANTEVEDAFVEIASSLKLSRNILIALISLQSWKSFMHRWMKVQLMLLETKAHSSMLDKSSKAATYILKTMCRIAEECIPSCAENCALAIGAFCLVLPLPAHAVKSAASKFLLGWLLQYEHEYRQWSAAISLGLISSCLHVTDHQQKHDIINSLLKVASKSKSALIKGACAIGLGFACQDLLRRVDSDCKSPLEKGTLRELEVELLRKIIGALSQMIGQFTESSAQILKKLPSCIPYGRDANSDRPIPIDSVDEYCADMEEDIWGVTGLVLGLASSTSALYRAGAHDAVLIIKDWLFSHIPCGNPLVEKLDMTQRHEMILCTSSCLALPIVVAFCQRVELIEDTEIHHLVRGSTELISELVSVENSGAFHQSLLMASCIGSGNLLSSILNGGLHSLKVDDVKSMLALFKKSYSTPHPSFVHLGGMLGVVNALGADAGILVQYSTAMKTDISSIQKESCHVTGPLLSSPTLEPEITSLVQEIFLVAQSSDDHQLREFAAWALSFLRHSLWLRPLENEEDTSDKDVAGSKSLSQNLPVDSMVSKLSFWLMHLNPEAGTISHINTVISALRCLSHASRLPTLDWGTVIRRCMRYEDQVVKLLATDSCIKKGVLREECLIFSIHFGDQFDSLLSFLDELSDLSRLRTLELNLQSCIFLHLADLTKIFSNFRIAKLFDDTSGFFSWLVSSDCRTSEERSLLCVSCWKGLYLCLDSFSHDVQDYISNMENCMEVLFNLLPSSGTCRGISLEWTEAVRCLGKARQGWLLDFLQGSEVNFKQESIHCSEVVKRMEAKARLVRIRSIPLNELGKLKSYMLNNSSEVVWNVLVEVAATLQHAEESAKRQWLLDTVQVSCVTSFPFTALQFLGLLCGNCSKYMPLLVADRNTVLSDLPVTLTSLLLDTNWGGVVEQVVSYLWTLTERIYEWTRSLLYGEKISSEQSIDRSENDKAVFLLQVVHHACVSLKDYLPREKQLRLANMVLP